MLPATRSITEYDPMFRPMIRHFNSIVYAAIIIQKRWRGYRTRCTWFWHLDVEIYWGDCIHNFRKHVLRRGVASYDMYYCDWCSADCVGVRYFCTSGCDFDLCEACAETEPIEDKLLVYVIFE